MTTGIGGKFEHVKRDPLPFQHWSAEREEKIKPKWQLQVYNVNSIVDEKLGEIKLDGGHVSDKQWEIYEDINKVIEEYRERIEQHLDRRIQLFFMQLICTWKTPYHFEWVEANDQYGKGCNNKLKKGKDQTTIFETVAAHSSTLPCLIAYPIEAWERYEREEENKPEGFVYLKYGHSYLQHNGTLELALCFNQADSLIDGTHNNSRLRNEALKIVNAVAKGEYGPKEGMKHFIRQLEIFIERGEKLQPSVSRLHALHCYSQRLREVKREMIEDDGYFDQLLGVKVAEHMQEDILRKIVYQKRFKLIQKCEDIESKIARDILDAQNRMLKTRKKNLKSLDFRLRYILLEDMDSIFRRKIERLFCTTLEQLQTGIEKNEKRLRAFEERAKIRFFRQSHAKEIAKLKAILHARFRELDNEELNYRSELLKGLRWNLNSWTQRALAEAYKKRFPLDSMSNSMASRLEQRTHAAYETKVYLTPLNQRRKDLSEERAKRISTTLGVDAGLFLPAIVSSMY
ncbi:MAG: hypothetical protein K1060chlam1_00192 [Candidatus Anoxychlamydiales bacterium]|nr:hypothetical protein [Candidatus Anoxychlamydiales bacterium]